MPSLTFSSRRPESQTNNNLRMEVEALEARKMLAGDVSANVTSAGDLVIHGDGLANSINVTVNANGFAEITGNDNEVIDLGNLSSSEVTGDIRISMRGGDDSVYVYDPRLDSEDLLKINLGSGDDIVEVRYTYSEIQISGGSGGDTMSIKYSGDKSPLTVSGGGGDDYASFYFADLPEATMNMGSGNDTVEFLESRFDEVQVSLRSGNDTMNISGAVVDEKITIQGNGGNDEVLIERIRSTGEFSMDLGAGNDEALIGDFDAERSEFDEISIKAGSGSDQVVFKYSDVSSAANIVTGSGNDQLSLSLLQLDSGLNANGGGGVDGLSMPSTQGGVNHTSFEDLTIG